MWLPMPLFTQSSLFSTMTVLVNTIASLQGLLDGVIAASEVHELPTKTHNILDNAVSEQVGNTAQI